MQLAPTFNLTQTQIVLQDILNHDHNIPQNLTFITDKNKLHINFDDNGEYIIYPVKWFPERLNWDVEATIEYLETIQDKKYLNQDQLEAQIGLLIALYKHSKLTVIYSTKEITSPEQTLKLLKEHKLKNQKEELLNTPLPYRYSTLNQTYGLGIQICRFMSRNTSDQIDIKRIKAVWGITSLFYIPYLSKRRRTIDSLVAMQESEMTDPIEYY
ncbi:2285_t:CDS:2, partial [Gigaspora rosea]